MDLAGYVLLGLATVAMVMGWDLSRRGLKEAAAAAEKAKTAAREAASAIVSSAQSLIPATGGVDAMGAADQQAKITAASADLTDSVGQVNEALKGLTGALAPARVLFAFALVLIVAALLALGVVDVSAGAST